MVLLSPLISRIVSCSISQHGPLPVLLVQAVMFPAWFSLQSRTRRHRQAKPCTSLYKLCCWQLASPICSFLIHVHKLSMQMLYNDGPGRRLWDNALALLTSCWICSLVINAPFFVEWKKSLLSVCYPMILLLCLCFVLVSHIIRRFEVRVHSVYQFPTIVDVWIKHSQGTCHLLQSNISTLKFQLTYLFAPIPLTAIRGWEGRLIGLYHCIGLEGPLFIYAGTEPACT